jgi:hypothetical protein
VPYRLTGALLVLCVTTERLFVTWQKYRNSFQRLMRWSTTLASRLKSYLDNIFYQEWHISHIQKLRVVERQNI